MRLDTGEVRRLAHLTGGEFFAAQSADALSRVYRTIDELETVSFKEPRYRIEERFLAFLVAGVALLLAGRMLRRSALEVLP